MTVLNFTLPPDVPKSADISGAFALLVAIGDKSTKATLEKLQAAVAEFRDAAAAAETALAKLDRRQAQLDARFATADEDIAKLRNEAERSMVNEKAAFDADIAGRLRDLEKRERQVEQEHAHNVKLHDDLERRLALVKQASV